MKAKQIVPLKILQMLRKHSSRKHSSIPSAIPFGRNVLKLHFRAPSLLITTLLQAYRWCHHHQPDQLEPDVEVCRNKSLAMYDHILENDIDMMALCVTCLIASTDA